MTRIKSSKIIATLLAVVMMLAFLSVSLTFASAEDTPTPAASSDTAGSDNDTAASDTTEKKAPVPLISITTYTYGAPDLNVTIDFKEVNAEPKLDYTDATNTSLVKTITDNIKVFSDKELTKEVDYQSSRIYSNYKYEDNKLTFTVPLNSAKGLSATTTYYLFLGKALTETTEVEGIDSSFEFKTNATTTSTTTRTTRTYTTRKTTYRTVTTRATTVRAKSANTGDPSHLPLWIGIVVASAVFGGMAFIAGKDHE